MRHLIAAAAPMVALPRASGGHPAVTLRAVQAGDEAQLVAFLDGLTLRSRHQRFCSGGTTAAVLARRLVHCDGERSGVVALDAAGTVVGHAEYVVFAADTAEVAVVVADALQGQGLGTRLVGWLVQRAAQEGVTRLVATVLPGNLAMVHVFRRHFGASVRDLGEELRIAFAAAPAADVPLAA